MSKPAWAEVHRQPVGFQAGSGKSGAWFCVVYRVTEALKVRGAVADYRERAALGPALRAVDYPDMTTLALMQSVATGADVLSRLCEAEEEKRKKPATSPRHGKRGKK